MYLYLYFWFAFQAAFVHGLPTRAQNLPLALFNNTFDYVIVGCGVSGLVVAARLTENPNTTVLCLEAGIFDSYEPMIQYPVYIGQQPPLFYEWGLITVPQAQLDGRSRYVPMGKGVGGGSLINGMIWNRGSQSDFDTWARLGNPGWSWNDLLPYFKKSETFTAQDYPGNDAEEPDSFNSSVHGYAGPAQVSYPKYLWPQTMNWFDALEELGIPESCDPNDGLTAGGYFLPSSIHPTNQTRSDARRSYYDPICERRPNYVLATNASVTRVLFDSKRAPVRLSLANRGNYSFPLSFTEPVPTEQVKAVAPTPRATGVEFASGPYSPRQTVLACRGVVLAAGAIHTPQILELSGIGSASLLRSLNISIIQDLPGVGNNLQDHAMIHLNYSYQNPNITSPYTFLTNSTFNAECEREYLTSKSGPWTSKPSTAVAFLSLAQTTNDTFIHNVLNSASNTSISSSYLPSFYFTCPSLLQGYNHQLHSSIRSLADPNTPAYEILNDNAGGLDLSLMRPLSRGSTHITSSDPFVSPAVDPRWLAHPADFSIMLAAMQFNQRILDTPSVRALLPSYDRIPANASIDFLTNLLRNEIGTEYHYSGTAAMLPQELGGVVDERLRVHGVAGLRVVDTSIYPIIPGAHLQAVAHAVAEKAADMIRGRRS